LNNQIWGSKTIFITTKSRKEKNTKNKKINFVFLKFRVFVVNNLFHHEGTKFTKIFLIYKEYLLCALRVLRGFNQILFTPQKDDNYDQASIKIKSVDCG